MQHLGDVEEHLVPFLALLAAERGDAVAPIALLTGSLAGALEQAPAVAPAAGQMPIDVGVRAHQDREVAWARRCERLYGEGSMRCLRARCMEAIDTAAVIAAVDELTG